MGSGVSWSWGKKANDAQLSRLRRVVSKLKRERDIRNTAALSSTGRCNA